LPLDSFCASAKHNSSPNTYSIDSASLISSGSSCGGAGGGTNISSSPNQTFESYNPSEIACGADGRARGAWSEVDEDGNMVPFKWSGLPGWFVCHCAACSTVNTNPVLRREQKLTKTKYVFGGLLNDEQLEREKFLNTREGGGTAGKNFPAESMGLETSTYNFATGIWTSIDGNRKFKNGERVE
jgi:hypothetical protein